MKKRIHKDLDEYYDNDDKMGWKTVTIFGAIKKRTDNSTSICIRHRIYQGRLYVDLAQWKKKLNGILTRVNTKAFHLDIESFQFLVDLIQEYGKSILINGDLKDPNSTTLLKSVKYAVKELPDDQQEMENILLEDMNMKMDGFRPSNEFYHNEKELDDEAI